MTKNQPVVSYKRVLTAQEIHQPKAQHNVQPELSLFFVEVSAKPYQIPLWRLGGVNKQENKNGGSLGQSSNDSKTEKGTVQTISSTRKVIRINVLPQMS